MVLKAFFQRLTSRKETAYDSLERLMTPELDNLMAEQIVSAARAQIQANLQLGQRTEAREACDRVMIVLDAYQSRAGAQAGRVELLRAFIFREAGRFEEAKIAYQRVLDGKIPLDDKHLLRQAQGGMELVRTRLQARLSTADANAQHLTVFYVCLKCGHLRLYLSAPCESCLYRPDTDAAIAASVMCSSDKMDFGDMQGISTRRGKGEKITSIVGNLTESIQQAWTETWFKQLMQQIRSSTDARTTRLTDFTSCPSCKAAIMVSMQEECECGAQLKLPPKQRLLICLDNLVRQIQDHWRLPPEWVSLEWVSALVWSRYFLLVHRQVPDLDLQSYLRDLLPKIGVLCDRDDRGFVQYDEKGKPSILVMKESDEDITMLTVNFTLFNVESLSMQKHFQDCAL